MRKFLVFNALVFIIIFTLESCKKDDFQPREFYVPQELLDYFYFKPGSYWIYQNNVTSEKDTLIVTRQTRTPYNSSRGDKLEEINVYYESSFENATYHYTINTIGTSSCLRDNNFNSGSPCYVLFCQKSLPDRFVGEATYFTFPFKEGNWGNSGPLSDNSKFTIQETYDSLNQNGVTFTSVAKIFINNCSHYSGNNITFFWAKNVGIIKRANTTNSQQWELIDYKIFK